MWMFSFVSVGYGGYFEKNGLLWLVIIFFLFLFLLPFSKLVR